VATGQELQDPGNGPPNIKLLTKSPLPPAHEGNISKLSKGVNTPSTFSETHANVQAWEDIGQDSQSQDIIKKKLEVNPSSKIIQGSKPMRLFEKKEGGNTNEITLKLFSWNVRSLCTSFKALEVVKADPDVVFLQELWEPKQETLDLIQGIKIKNLRGDGYGGTLIASKLVNLQQGSTPIRLNDDTVITKFILAGNRFIWLSSMYINHGTRKNLLNTMAEIQNKIPETDWPYLILAGDWNINLKDKENKVTEALNIICKNMNLTVLRCGDSRKEREIDFFVCGSKIDVKDTKLVNCQDLSDHHAIWAEIAIKAPEKSLRTTKMPDKMISKDITIQSLQECSDAESFLLTLKKLLKKNKHKLWRKIRIKTKDNELLKRILSLRNCDLGEEDDSLTKAIKDYWKEKAIDCETMLGTNRLKEAFSFLRKVYKYHEFNRRDGSIIDKIRRDDGTVTYEEEEVHKLLIENLKNTQLKENEPIYKEPLPFPVLPILDQQEMVDIVSKISHGKALSVDGVSDIIFAKNQRKVATQKLQNLWSIEDKPNFLFNPIHFETKIIPLNKVHPQIPSNKDCRPIAVQSPIVKLMESRLKSKLDNYMTQKVHPGQTGFITGMGISVNQMRLIQRIIETTHRKKHCYGLFVDFSSAYNTILHSKLFERLQDVLSKDELEYLKSIYSRTRITLGKTSFCPNIGVAQGSTISPALFNIYCDDLYKKLSDSGISIDSIFGYADDLCVLCTSPSELRNVIRLIKSWSEENNLKLNTKKSGILEFTPRYGSQPHYLKINSEFEGIPIVTEYRYLGLIFDAKLTMTKQLELIDKKSNFQVTKLWPILKMLSLEERINLWTLLVRPLFEMLIFLYYSERSHTNIERAQRMIRKTLKKFCMLKKNVDNSTINRMMDFDFNKRAGEVVELTALKWEARKNHNIPIIPQKSLLKTEKIYYPRELQELLNIKTALCPVCRVPSSSEHLHERHNIQIPENTELLELMRTETESHIKEGKKKLQIIKELGLKLIPYITSIKAMLTNLNIKQGDVRPIS